MSMCRSNFRVKLDLWKFYNDVRRFCWIFIDGTKMLQIVHIKQHITKLLNIEEPFHLLLNDTEYLPPNEDIRILKENETILVSPGSGLEGTFDSSVNTTTTLPQNRNRQEVESSSVKAEQPRNSVQHKQLQTNLSFMVSNLVQQTVPSDTANRSQDESLELASISHELKDSETDSIAETKSVDTALTEEVSVIENIMARPKRKRVRRGGKKRQQRIEQLQMKEEENKLKKPKIINSCIITSGKHIRFDNLDNDNSLEEQDMHLETMNGNDTANVSPSHELANLLSLGKNSVPLTFTANTRVKEEVKVEHISDEEVQFGACPENINESIVLTKKSEQGKELLNKDFETYPIMTEKPQLKDVIAFKMLKIGSDYTPQVSAFIVAEVISCCTNTSVYTFKVLEGLSEVQVPIGKFTVVDEKEERVMSDTITLNYAQIREPRLVSRCDQDGAVTPINCIN